MNKKTPLHTITLTVNGICNMACEHCYLSFKNSSDKYVSDEIVAKLLDIDFKHLSIVGKEPFFNEEHTRKTEELVAKFKQKGVSISIVSNGKNLHLAKDGFFQEIDSLDISFDGGPETYSNNRQNSFENLVENLRRAKNLGLKSLNALNILFLENYKNIDDIMSINDFLNIEEIMICPYLKTNRQGENSRTTVSIDKICKALSESKKFIESKNAFLFIEKDHLDQDGISKENFLQIAKKYNMPPSKYRILEKPALQYGIVRISWDGKIFSPEDAIHTKDYDKAKNVLEKNKSIIDFYNEL